MSLFDVVRKAFGPSGVAERSAGRTYPEARPEQAEIRVSELTPAELMAELRDETRQKPLLLDCREDFERRQVFIPNSKHMVMNTIPHRLSELDRGQELIVYCAHGHRSYDVTAWLMQQGYRVRSLKGGIAEWQARGGAVESDMRRPL